MDSLAFYVFAAVSLTGAIGIVVTTNIVRTAICLLGTLGGVACLYFLLDANFLAVVQLIVYAGGTLILIVFGVMLTSKSPWVGFSPPKGQAILAILVSVLMAFGICTLVLQADWGAPSGVLEQSPTVAEIGQTLLTKYLVPFEVASVLLLVVMIGAAYMSRPEE